MVQQKEMLAITLPSALASPQVSLVNKSAPDAAARAVGVLLTVAARMLNVGGNLSDGQIGMIAQALLTRYYYLRFDEFAYVLSSGVMGKYGTLYNKFDADTIGQWMSAYEANERWDALAAADAARAEADKANAAAVVADPGIVRAYEVGKARLLTEAQLMGGIRHYLYKLIEAPAHERGLIEHILGRMDIGLQVMAERWRTEARSYRHARAAIRHKLQNPSPPGWTEAEWEAFNEELQRDEAA